MTRRVVLAIILNVWLVLITAGCSTYFIVRSLLLADLDETITSRVASLPGIERPESQPSVTPDAQDRFVIHDKTGRVVSSLVTTQPAGGPAPVIIGRAFATLSNGTHVRTLTLQAFARPAAGAAPQPVTVVYSASCDHVDTLLHNLFYSFTFFGILAAVASALAAQSVARAALRPMRDTAELLGKIDERSLHRRVRVEELPPELAPIGVKLNDMLGRLETAFSQRRQFLADASHELRTPVAALVTALEVALRRRRGADEYERVLDQALGDARLLHQLVVALLEQARAERFGDNPEFGPSDVATFLRRCLDTLAPLAQRKGLVLEMRTPDNLTVITDEGLLRSAVVNLLSNAVEYTPPGPGRGRIVASAKMTDWVGVLPEGVDSAVPEGVTGRAGLLVIEVRDDGLGIGAEHLPNIFESFYRAAAPRSEAKHHLGLGLAAVRLNVRCMGGECRVESPPAEGGSGCVFLIELPTMRISADRDLPTQRERVAPVQGS